MSNEAVQPNSLWAYYDQRSGMLEAIVCYVDDSQEPFVFHHGNLGYPDRHKDSLKILKATLLDGFHEMREAGELVEINSLPIRLEAPVGAK